MISFVWVRLPFPRRRLNPNQAPAAEEEVAAAEAQAQEDAETASTRYKDLRARADLVLGFGPMVWPHMLVRVMAAEQIYRAAAILAGTPYHRA